MHEIFRSMTFAGFLVMLVIPLVMTVMAVGVGLVARQSARDRQMVKAAPRGPGDDALPAALTVATVPFAFAVFMLWARFG